MEKFFVDFRNATNKTDLAKKYIGISEDLFDFAIAEDKVEIISKTLNLKRNLSKYINCYQQHFIPKKSKKSLNKHRLVWEIKNDELEVAYKNLARRLNIFITNIREDFPCKSSYGYIKGRNTLDNAKNHCGANFLLNADIKDFFPSIKTDDIKSKFLQLGINHDVSLLLSKFVTINEELPLGFSTSPIISNLVCIDLDKKLNDLSAKYNCSYSRYADDISISGQLAVPSKDEIRVIFEEEKFKLAENKFTIKKIGQAQFVTGLSISDIKYPHAPRKIKKKLRQEIYYCSKLGIKEHLNHRFLVKFENYIKKAPEAKDVFIKWSKNGIDQDTLQKGINRVDGMVRYVAHIEGNSPFNFCDEWKSLLQKENLRPSYHQRREKGSKNIEFYVDETEIKINGKNFLILCFTKFNDSNEISQKTSDLVDSKISDPFFSGNKNNLKKNRLHWCDSNEDLRAEYIRILSSYHYKSYLIYGELRLSKNYCDLYTSFIKSALPHRLMGCDMDKVSIIFEESKVKRHLIENVVSGIYNQLEMSDNRRPIEVPNIIIGKKKDYPCFSVPDSLLGIFRNYVSKDLGKNPRFKSHFEELRDKYRLITNFDNKESFSRKKIFYPQNFIGSNLF